ncbi:UNVERIFIED_CONTAM: hypothetical protein FKN15_015144 [Acipenser sinensis]
MRSIVWTLRIRVQAIPQPVDGSSQGEAHNWPSVAQGEGGFYRLNVVDPQNPGFGTSVKGGFTVDPYNTGIEVSEIEKQVQPIRDRIKAEENSTVKFDQKVEEWKWVGYDSMFFSLVCVMYATRRRD